MGVAIFHGFLRVISETNARVQTQITKKTINKNHDAAIIVFYININDTLVMLHDVFCDWRS